MFEKWKNKIVHASKETVVEEIKAHSNEIATGITLCLLLYLCIKINGKPVNITVNVNGGMPFQLSK